MTISSPPASLPRGEALAWRVIDRVLPRLCLNPVKYSVSNPRPCLCQNRGLSRTGGRNSRKMMTSLVVNLRVLGFRACPSGLSTAHSVLCRGKIAAKACCSSLQHRNHQGSNMVTHKQRVEGHEACLTTHNQQDLHVVTRDAPQLSALLASGPCSEYDGHSAGRRFFGLDLRCSGWRLLLPDALRLHLRHDILGGWLLQLLVCSTVEGTNSEGLGLYLLSMLGGN